jgi:CRISPR-associated protein Cas5, N-terminal domain
LIKVLRVVLRGRMAHFRKVYSNSTSLSYYFPPRTTVLGIVAAALGLPRDSYYDKLNQLNVGVSAVTPLRKLTVGEDILDTDYANTTKLRGLSNRVPTTKELILPYRENFLGYSIYLHPYSSEMVQAFKNPAFPLSLGTANMLTWTEAIEELECTEVGEGDSEQTRRVEGAVPSSVRVEFSEGIQLTLEDGVPTTFQVGRVPGKLANYYFSVGGTTYQVRGKFRGALCGDRVIAFL